MNLLIMLLSLYCLISITFLNAMKNQRLTFDSSKTSGSSVDNFYIAIVWFDSETSKNNYIPSFKIFLDDQSSSLYPLNEPINATNIVLFERPMNTCNKTLSQTNFMDLFVTGLDPNQSHKLTYNGIIVKMCKYNCQLAKTFGKVYSILTNDVKCFDFNSDKVTGLNQSTLYPSINFYFFPLKFFFSKYNFKCTVLAVSNDFDENIAYVDILRTYVTNGNCYKKIYINLKYWSYMQHADIILINKEAVLSVLNIGIRVIILLMDKLDIFNFMMAAESFGLNDGKFVFIAFGYNYITYNSRDNVYLFNDYHLNNIQSHLISINFYFRNSDLLLYECLECQQSYLLLKNSSTIVYQNYKTSNNTLTPLLFAFKMLFRRIYSSINKILVNVEEISKDPFYNMSLSAYVHFKVFSNSLDFPIFTYNVNTNKTNSSYLFELLLNQTWPEFPPPDQSPCGYLNNKCSRMISKDLLIIIFSMIGVICLIICIVLIALYIRYRIFVLSIYNYIIIPDELDFKKKFKKLSSDYLYEDKKKEKDATSASVDKSNLISSPDQSKSSDSLSNNSDNKEHSVISSKDLSAIENESLNLTGILPTTNINRNAQKMPVEKKKTTVKGLFSMTKTNKVGILESNAHVAANQVNNFEELQNYARHRFSAITDRKQLPASNTSSNARNNNNQGDQNEKLEESESQGQTFDASKPGMKQRYMDANKMNRLNNPETEKRHLRSEQKEIDKRASVEIQLKELRRSSIKMPQFINAIQEIQNKKRRSGLMARFLRLDDRNNQRISMVQNTNFGSLKMDYQLLKKYEAVYQDRVVFIKKILCNDLRINFFNTTLLQEISQMRDLNHENIVSFIGVCLNASLIVMSYAKRGSLCDLLSNKSHARVFNLPLLTQMLIDIAKGMDYLHNSPLGSHGNLSSKCCVIDGRWRCKVTNYGLGTFRLCQMDTSKNYRPDEKEMNKLLYMCPELLRTPKKMRPTYGTRTSDVYSFAIIIQEVLLMDVPYANEIYKDKMTLSSILSKVRSGNKNNILRPNLGEYEKTKWSLLTKDCWHEHADRRLNFQQIIAVLKEYMHSRSSTFTELLSQRLEEHASNLKGMVNDATASVANENAKCDQLLYNLLPKVVADEMRIGKIIEPELYHCVTLLNTDIVGFTKIAAKSTPLQIVQLLSNLYNMYDQLTGERDAYKVETVGDAYYVCSGCPIRNNNRHAKEIAMLALDFFSFVARFKIPHLDKDVLHARCGIHSGPVITGVVGIKAPRFCLFGDTCIITEAMEGSGLPNLIHISKATVDLLTKSDFLLESRGIMEIDKEKMETYFLLSVSASYRLRKE